MAKEAVTVTLSEPVEFGSETITQLVVQPLKGKHLRGLSDSPGIGDLLDLAEQLTGKQREVIDGLSAKDAIRVSQVVSSFFEGTDPEPSGT